MAAATSTLDTIRTKVRRLTRSPSQAQLSDNDLDQYINTAIENDIPTTLKLFSLRTLLTFYTQPGVDVYGTNTTNALDPLFNFQNKYTAVHPPAYIAGVQCFWTEERAVFYGNWPQTNFVQWTGLTGDGTTGPFNGIIPPYNQQPNPPFINNFPFLLQNSIMFSALDASGTAMILTDNPVSNTTGALGLPGQPQTLPSPYGQVNYISGAYTLNFPSPTLPVSSTENNPIESTYIAYGAGIPTTILYYNNEFTIRPVPDKAYAVQVEVNIRPTELLQSTDVPQITQWWQWISALAARKVFEDRMDTDSVQQLMPFLTEQQSLVLSTSMEQYTNQRTVTIYTQNGVNNGWNNFGRWPY